MVVTASATGAVIAAARAGDSSPTIAINAPRAPRAAASPYAPATDS